MFDFIKKNPGILFSLALIVLIPVLIFFNIFFIISAFQEHLDDSLHSKAILGQTIFALLASEYIQQPEIIQSQIEQMQKMEGGEKIIDLQVIAPGKEGELEVKAAKNQNKIGTTVEMDPTIIMPWYQGRPFASLRMENNERVWFVVNTFFNQETGEKLGLISLTLSLAQTDALIHRTILLAYLFLVITILVVLFLVAHHTKLFTYVVLYDKLKEVDAIKDNFVRMATHELQSPITVIRGYIEELEEEMKDSLVGNKREFIKRIKVSAKNLSDLVYDILEVARLEQGRLDFTPQKISPPKVIFEIIQGLKIKTEQKNLDLVFENAKEDVDYIKINPNRFYQILTNLLENAIKYTPAGKISVKTRKDENKKEYIIEIEDSGLGISAIDQKRLFEKFYRVKTKATAEIPGTGLGLWLTKQMVEGSGGKIFVESIEGKGTKFILSFPLIKL